MAYKKTKTENLEDTVTDSKDVDIAKTSSVKNVVPEPAKKILIATQPTNAYKIPTLGSKYISSQLVCGTPYEIVDEIESSINGKFYKIYTGEYVSVSSNIIIN